MCYCEIHQFSLLNKNMFTTRVIFFSIITFFWLFSSELFIAWFFFILSYSKITQFQWMWGDFPFVYVLVQYKLARSTKHTIRLTILTALLNNLTFKPLFLRNGSLFVILSVLSNNVIHTLLGYYIHRLRLIHFSATYLLYHIFFWSICR